MQYFVALICYMAIKCTVQVHVSAHDEAVQFHCIVYWNLQYYETCMQNLTLQMQGENCMMRQFSRIVVLCLCKVHIMFRRFFNSRLHYSSHQVNQQKEQYSNVLVCDPVQHYIQHAYRVTYSSVHTENHAIKHTTELHGYSKGQKVLLSCQTLPNSLQWWATCCGLLLGNDNEFCPPC